MSGIILFDGVCNLCNQSVQFIIKRDPNANFKFTSLQSDAGKKLLRQYEIPNNINSFILIENGRVYQQSSAALLVTKKLRGYWKLFYIGWIIPKPIRDAIYQIISRNRYKWFGREESCMVSTPAMKDRFLD